MTTHALSAFRTDAPRGDADEESCTFCAIARNHPHSSTASTHPTTSSPPASPSPSAHLTYSDPSSIAILDILPIRRGHTLVIPRRHIRHLSDLPLDQAADFAKALVRVTRMVGTALGDDRLQVITNQVYAQVVPHLHFHIVPAPPLPGSRKQQDTDTTTSKNDKLPHRPVSLGSPASASLLKAFGHGRDELEEDDAAALTTQMRQALRSVLELESQAQSAHKESRNSRL